MLYLFHILFFSNIYVRIKIRCSTESERVRIVQCPAEITRYPHQLLSKWRAININLFSGGHTLHNFYNSCETDLIQ